MALKLANIEVEVREISLRDKPAHMLQVSPKGSVPVLVLQDGSVIDESLEIMFFALQNHASALEHSSASLGGNIHAGCIADILFHHPFKGSVRVGV